MPDTTFHLLVPSWAPNGTRRGLLHLLAALPLLAPLLALLDPLFGAESEAVQRRCRIQQRRGGGRHQLQEERKKKRKNKKKKRKKPCPPSALPPPVTCEATGCPYTQVCKNGVCEACFGMACALDGDCCTNRCQESEGMLRCACLMGSSGICTSNANCCNGHCNQSTGFCACDPAGTPCPFGNFSCCGACIGGFCQ